LVATACSQQSLWSLKAMTPTRIIRGMKPGVSTLHRGADTRDPSKRRRIITPEQFGAPYAALPTREMQLLVETDVETGLR
jgi:hypothetical protein